MQQHIHGLGSMKMMGPMARNRNNVCLMTLKNSYCFVFLNQMESDLVGRARLAGFHTLWLIKNCLLQKSESFGLNGYQFSTLDKQPKSYLHLVGFHKGSVEGGDLRIIPLTNSSNEFLRLSDH